MPQCYVLILNTPENIVMDLTQLLANLIWSRENYQLKTSIHVTRLHVRSQTQALGDINKKKIKIGSALSFRSSSITYPV